MPDEQDRNKAQKYVTASVKKRHWTGEGVGGSGHMACVYVGFIKVETVEAVEHKAQACTRVTFTYEVIRESEFGGNMDLYRACAVYDEGGVEMTYEELDHQERDLLSPEPYEEFAPENEKD